MECFLIELTNCADPTNLDGENKKIINEIERKHQFYDRLQLEKDFSYVRNVTEGEEPDEIETLTAKTVGNHGCLGNCVV